MEEFILKDKERIKIFQILTKNREITFNKLAKETRLRSNKLSYQLNLMKENNFIIKNDDTYSLTAEARRLVPYFSQILKKEVGVLPVVLGMVVNKDEILLIKRNKMPYLGYWSLLGGKQIGGESVAETIEREVKEEAAIEAKFTKCNGVVYERTREDKDFIHSFLLILTSLKAQSKKVMEQNEGEVKWVKLQDVLKGNIEKMHPTDAYFIKEYFDKEMNLEHVIAHEKNGKITLDI